MEQEAPERYFRISLIPIILCMFVNPFLGSGLNLSVLSISSHFNVDAVTVGWIVTAYALGIAAFSIPLGKVADLVGRRKIFIAGASITGLSSLAAIVSPDFAFLLASRLVQAVGSALMNASVIPVAVSMYPPTLRGKTLGICTSSVYVGGAAGPVVGGFLNEYLGWQSIFALCVVLMSIATVMAVRFLPPETQVRTQPLSIDGPGTVLYMLMIVFVLFGFSQVGSSSLAGPVLVLGVVFTVLFVMVEARVADPVIRLSLFTKDRVFTLSCLAALLNYGATSALGYLLSIYLQGVAGLSSQYAGLVMISQPLLMAVISPIAGSMSDRIPAWKLASAGMAFCATALGLLTLLDAQSPLWLIVLALLCAGVGFGLFSSPNTNAIMSCVSPAEFSLANTIVAAMRTVGQTVGMCLVTVVVAFNLGAVPLADAPQAQMVGTIHICFAIFAVLCVMGLGMSLARRR